MYRDHQYKTALSRSRGRTRIWETKYIDVSISLLYTRESCACVSILTGLHFQAHEFNKIKKWELDGPIIDFIRIEQAEQSNPRAHNMEVYTLSSLNPWNLPLPNRTHNQ